jgi:hypothetical protein
VGEHHHQDIILAEKRESVKLSTHDHYFVFSSENELTFKASKDLYPSGIYFPFDF